MAKEIENQEIMEAVYSIPYDKNIPENQLHSIAERLLPHLSGIFSKAPDSDKFRFAKYSSDKKFRFYPHIQWEAGINKSNNEKKLLIFPVDSNGKKRKISFIEFGTFQHQFMEANNFIFNENEIVFDNSVSYQAILDSKTGRPYLRFFCGFFEYMYCLDDRLQFYLKYPKKDPFTNPFPKELKETIESLKKRTEDVKGVEKWVQVAQKILDKM